LTDKRTLRWGVDNFSGRFIGGHHRWHERARAPRKDFVPNADFATEGALDRGHERRRDRPIHRAAKRGDPNVRKNLRPGRFIPDGGPGTKFLVLWGETKLNPYQTNGGPTPRPGGAPRRRRIQRIVAGRAGSRPARGILGAPHPDARARDKGIRK